MEAAYSTDGAKRRLEILARKVSTRFQSLMMEPSDWASNGRIASRAGASPAVTSSSPAVAGPVLRLWDQGFHDWHGRAAQDARLVFTCELGPKPYAITGADGNDLTDRWTESLLLRDHVLELWRK